MRGFDRGCKIALKQGNNEVMRLPAGKEIFRKRYGELIEYTVTV